MTNTTPYDIADRRGYFKTSILDVYVIYIILYLYIIIYLFIYYL